MSLDENGKQGAWRWVTARWNRLGEGSKRHRTWQYTTIILPPAFLAPCLQLGQKPLLAVLIDVVALVSILESKLGNLWILTASCF